MQFFSWLIVLWEIVKFLLPWGLGVVFALFFFSLAGDSVGDPQLTPVVFVLVALVCGALLRKEVFPTLFGK